MNMKILAALPLSYIAAWFYLLFTWTIPILSQPFIQLFVNLNVWQLISIILFFVPGIPFLCLAIFFFLVILLASD